MNLAVFTGTIARDEWKVSGKVARNALRVRRDGPQRDGEPDVDFVPITVLGEKMIEFVQHWFPKGKWAEVVGSYRTYQFEGQNGTVHGHEFVVNRISFVGAKADGNGSSNGSSRSSAAPAQQPAKPSAPPRSEPDPWDDDDDVPF